MKLETDYKERVLSFIKRELGVGIIPEVKETANKVTAILDIPDDNTYGIVFSRLEKNKELEYLDDNQFVTEQGSNIIYVSRTDNSFIITLMADYLNDKYSLNVSLNKGDQDEQ